MDTFHYIDFNTENSDSLKNDRISQMAAVQDEGLELFKKRMQIMVMHLLNLE